MSQKLDATENGNFLLTRRPSPTLFTLHIPIISQKRRISSSDMELGFPCLRRISRADTDPAVLSAPEVGKSPLSPADILVIASAKSNMKKVF